MTRNGTIKTAWQIWESFIYMKRSLSLYSKYVYIEKREKIYTEVGTRRLTDDLVSRSVPPREGRRYSAAALHVHICVQHPTAMVQECRHRQIFW